MPLEENAPKATHRLTSMFVQEVSLVDKAANGEVFLIAKRDPEMNAKLKKEDAATAAAGIAEDTAAAGSGEAGSMQAQVKDELLSALATIAEKIISIANEAEGATVTDQPVTPAVPASITTQIGDLAKELSAIGAKYGGASDTVAANENEGAKPAGAPAAPATKSDDDDDKKEMTDAEKSAVRAAEAEVMAKKLVPAKHPDLVAKSVAVRLSVRLDAAQAIVRKAGRRMAKERLERLGKAIDMLIGLLKELRYDNEKRAQKIAAQRAAAQATAKSAIATEAITTAELAALLDDTDRVIKSHADLAAELAKSAANEKTMKARIAELEKRTGPSNLLIPEPKSPATSNGSAVHWPGDLNDLPAVQTALENKNRPATAR